MTFLFFAFFVLPIYNILLPCSKTSNNKNYEKNEQIGLDLRIMMNLAWIFFFFLVNSQIDH